MSCILPVLRSAFEADLHIDDSDSYPNVPYVSGHSGSMQSLIERIRGGGSPIHGVTRGRFGGGRSIWSGPVAGSRDAQNITKQRCSEGGRLG